MTVLTIGWTVRTPDGASTNDGRHCRTPFTCSSIRGVPGSVQSIERAAAILRLLAERLRPAGHRRDRPLARPGQGHHPRHPAHAAGASGFVEQDDVSGQVPARRGAAAPGHELPRRQRAALALDQLGRPARRAQRRGGPHRHDPGRQGARRAPRLPSRRHVPDARRRLAAAAARHRDGQGAARLRRGRHAGGAAGRSGAVHPAHHRPARRSSAAPSARSASRAGPPRSRR